MPLSADYSLDLHVDHSPGARVPIKQLRKEWLSQGLLYTQILKTDPIKVRIVTDRHAKACQIRVD